MSLAAVLALVIGSVAIADNDSNQAELRDSDKEAVILIHGLGRSNTAMWSLASKLEDAGFYIQRVGYSSFNTTSEEVIADITKQINDCCADHHKPVHFVGHSLGGLLIRAYLKDNKVKNHGNVVMIGTPNHGTDVADRYKSHCLIDLIPIAAALGTDEQSLPNTLPAPDYPVGIIAGISQRGLNEEQLPGLDDGLVSVESTKLEGMSDFTTVFSGHSMLRYNDEVANQTIAFLKNRKFLKAMP